MSAPHNLGAQFGRYLLTQHDVGPPHETRSLTNYQLWHEDMPHFPLPRESGDPGWAVGHLNVFRSSPERAVVLSLGVGKAHRAIAPVMLGVAHNTVAESGGALIPSGNLSPFSHRLVQRAAARGLLHPSMVPNEVSNQVSFSGQEEEDIRTQSQYDVSRERIEEGRHTMRNMLRMARHIG